MDGTNQYDQITKELSGLSLPVDPSACYNRTPVQQIQCLDDLQTNMVGLFKGTGPNSSYVINVPGVLPQHNINFQCQGINGCTNAYQQFYDAVDREVKRVGNYKKDFVTKSNSNLNQITSQIQGQAATYMKTVKDYASKVNQTLMSLSVDATLKLSAGAPEKPTYGGSTTNDGTKLMDAPSDMASFLGLPDLKNEDMYQTVNSAVVKKRNEIQKNKSDAEAVKSKIDSLVSSCGKQDAKSAADAINQQISNWNAQNCSYMQNFDPNQTSNGSNLDDLFAIVNNAKSSDSYGSLLTGINPPDSATAQLYAEKDQLKCLLGAGCTTSQTLQQCDSQPPGGILQSCKVTALPLSTTLFSMQSSTQDITVINSSTCKSLYSSISQGVKNYGDVGVSVKGGSVGSGKAKSDN